MGFILWSLGGKSAVPKVLVAMILWRCKVKESVELVTMRYPFCTQHYMKSKKLHVCTKHPSSGFTFQKYKKSILYFWNVKPDDGCSVQQKHVDFWAERRTVSLKRVTCFVDTTGKTRVKTVENGLRHFYPTSQFYGEDLWRPRVSIFSVNFRRSCLNFTFIWYEDHIVWGHRPLEFCNYLW